jgi:hypothetical protein
MKGKLRYTLRSNITTTRQGNSICNEVGFGRDMGVLDSGVEELSRIHLIYRIVWLNKGRSTTNTDLASIHPEKIQASFPSPLKISLPPCGFGPEVDNGRV